MWWRILAVMASGAIQAWISPPLNLHFLHWFSWIPFLWAIDRPAHARGNFALGWLCGISASFAIFYWLTDTIAIFSNLPLVAAWGVLLLFSLAFGAYAGFVAWTFPKLKRFAGPWWPLAFAACFVSFEFLNPQLFPFYQGVSQYQVARLFQLVTITGVPGVSFLLMTVNALLYAAIRQRVDGGAGLEPRHLKRGFAALAAVLLAILGYGELRLRAIARAEASAETLRIGLVQANYGVVRRGETLRRRGGRDLMLDDYFEATRRAAAEGAQVVVWPEGGSPYRPDIGRGQRIARLADELDIELWIGATRIVANEAGEREGRNTAWQIRADGEIADTYDKIFLLPFGEYMPGRDLFPSIKQYIQGPGDYRPGTEMTVFNGPGDLRFHFLICYEAIRTLMVREGVRGGSEMLVNITFDDWFGTSSCLSQHLMLAAIQGAIYGMPLVRCATTGISAYADARGQLVATTAPAVEELLIVDVPLVHVRTPATSLGHSFAWLMVILSAGMLWLSGHRGLVGWGLVPLAGVGLVVFVPASSVIAQVGWAIAAGGLVRWLVFVARSRPEAPPSAAVAPEPAG